MFSRVGRIRSLPPADQVPEEGYEEPFELRWLTAPVLTGLPLKLFLAVAEGPFAGPVRRQLLRNNNYPQIMEELFIPERPTFHPNTSGWRAEDTAGLAALGSQHLSAAERAAAAAALAPACAASSSAEAVASGGSGKGGSNINAHRQRHHTAADYRHAYATHATTPAQVAENIIAAVVASEAQTPPMRFFVAHDPEHLRRQAAASTQRWREGCQLSPLDGVPFAVKDGCDALPYPTTAGTGFMADWRTPTHSLAGVQALLDAGALLIGKATLHEIGLGTTGLNTVTGTARNPHSTAHHTGGSSSGSSALVAAGICPFAVGSDGGGSIRIPAAACGVVGLKPTHERVGTAVGGPPIDQTVSVLGPIAATVQDCALIYAVMGNTGQKAGTAPPAIMLPAKPGGGRDQPLAGKTAGICWKWFDMSAPAVAAACRAAVALLQQRGLSVVELQLPELALLRAAHGCTITSEMRNNMTGALQDGPTRRQMNLETRASLAVAAGFEAAHYLQAQKIRTRVEAHFRRAFSKCDFIITPTLPCTAPPIKPAALTSGESDLTTTTSLMHYVLAPNFIGLPAISIPVGAVPSTHATPSAAAGVAASSAAGAAPASASPGQSGVAGAAGSSSDGAVSLPVGLQLMAPCWHEASLLHVGAVLEAAIACAAGSPPPVPPVWYDVLAGGKPLAGGGSDG